jgi:hypothetical protein
LLCRIPKNFKCKFSRLAESDEIEHISLVNGELTRLWRKKFFHFVVRDFEMYENLNIFVSHVSILYNFCVNVENFPAIIDGFCINFLHLERGRELMGALNLINFCWPLLMMLCSFHLLDSRAIEHEPLTLFAFKHLKQKRGQVQKKISNKLSPLTPHNNC